MIVNVVMNLCVLKMLGISSLAVDLLALQEGFCSMELISFNTQSTVVRHTRILQLYHSVCCIMITAAEICPKCVGF